MTLIFTIYGNHLSHTGNPIPKVKLTFKQQWTPTAQRYAAWKEYVQQAYHDRMMVLGLKVFIHDIPRALTLKTLSRRYLKPLDVKEASMHLKIYWANETHADPESIFGSIADALFVDDKHVSGSFEYEHCPESKGRVEVTITIPHDNAIRRQDSRVRRSETRGRR